jgi:2-amino-4-hydroxy-6-hydroxymethyldihydropteridine diphosphokinase
LPEVFLGVGSNLEPERHLGAALERLAVHLTLEDVSTFYLTIPLGGRAQPPFWNGVLAARTELDPWTLKFQVLHGVEASLGRMRSEDRFASRTLDLDLLIYGKLVLAEERLVLPDPVIRERPFVARPLLELAPGLVLPDTGEALAELVSRMPDDGSVPLCEATAQLRAQLRALSSRPPGATAPPRLAPGSDRSSPC